MSRSRKKTPVLNLTNAKTRKQDRTRANRLFRRFSKQLLQQEEELPEKVREVSDIWDWDCDGWKFFNLEEFYDDFREKVMRK